MTSKLQTNRTFAGKTALVTGSTDGVGRCVAKRLAAAGATVLLHGRDHARGEELVCQIGKVGTKAAFYPADLASLSAVRALAANIKHDHARLDILINNAGIGVGARRSQREESSDGYELRFAVNYLSGFLLTRLLLPLVIASGPSRIINVASVGQQQIDFSDVMLVRGYSGTRAYCQSKLAQIMFTFDLAEQLANSRVTSNCLHPATYMDTTMVRLDGISPMSTVEDGADAIMQLATSDKMDGKTGLYFDGLRQSRPNGQAYDRQARIRLRALSLQLTGLPNSEPELQPAF